MSTLIPRVAGALLAVLGLVAAVVGGWFLANLGTSGTATFTAEPGQRVVVLEPDVLNRVDHPVEITATGSGDVWVGTARPSDVEAFFGDAQRAQVAGVDVSDWALTATDQGQGEAIDPAGLDIWQQSSAAKGEITRTVDQDDAPQTFVVAAPEGSEIESVTMTVEDGSWGTTALVTLVVGLLLLAAGIVLLIRSGLAGVIRSRVSRTTREERA